MVQQLAMPPDTFTWPPQDQMDWIYANKQNIKSMHIGSAAVCAKSELRRGHGSLGCFGRPKIAWILVVLALLLLLLLLSVRFHCCLVALASIPTHSIRSNPILSKPILSYPILADLIRSDLCNWKRVFH